jgi:hypothetical protein
LQHLRFADGAERNVLPLHDVWEHERVFVAGKHERDRKGGLLSCSHSKPPRDSRASLKVDAKSLCQFFAEYSICFAFSNKGLVIKRSSNAAGCGDPPVIASSGPRCGKGPSNPHEQARACYPALC